MRTRPAGHEPGGVFLTAIPPAEDPAKTMPHDEATDGTGGSRRRRPTDGQNGGNGIAELARAQAEAAIRTLSSIMRSRKGAPAARIAAANALLSRGLGRPSPGDGAPDRKGAADLSDEELLRIIEGRSTAATPMHAAPRRGTRTPGTCDGDDSDNDDAGEEPA